MKQSWKRRLLACAAAVALMATGQAALAQDTVYTGRLQALLSESVSDDGYTADSVAAYQQALAKGESVLRSASATQQQINSAVLSIVHAKMSRTPQAPDEAFQTLVTFPGSNQATSYLTYGKSFYLNWQTGQGLGDQSSPLPGVDMSGTADNGSDPLTYVQLKMALTAFSEGTDLAACWKQIGLRLRSSAVDGKEQAAGFYYVQPQAVTADRDGVYTIRIPLRVMDTQNIRWADVKQLNIMVEVADAYRLTTADGGERAGDSPDIGLALTGVSLVKKVVYAAGDVNGDGTVAAADALMALQAATGQCTLNAPQQAAADVDNTKGIGAVDALMILQAATGRITIPERGYTKMVAFTFDDGPSENTAALLDALKERGAHATFFVVGKETEKRPELVARMAAEGHAVGNHSYSHDGINITGRDEMIADYDKCSDLIQQYTGKRPTLMRAVGGSSVESIRDYIVAQDLRLCGWMGGGPDYNQTDKDVVVSYYMKDGRCTISDGDLVLLHENHTSSVAAALELMDLLMQEGYRCVTVPELLAARADGGVAGNTYTRVVSMD